MKYHRKLQIVRQLSKRVRNAQVNKLLHSQEDLYASDLAPGEKVQQTHIEDQEEDISESIQGQGQEDGLADDEFNVLDYISSLPPKMRQQFRKSNPQLPDIFFMTRQQKKKYFESINQSFKKKLSKTPQRKSKTKKILKFKNEFQIKPFNEQQKVIAISKAKQFSEPYKPSIHFS